MRFLIAVGASTILVAGDPSTQDGGRRSTTSAHEPRPDGADVLPARRVRARGAQPRAPRCPARAGTPDDRVRLAGAARRPGDARAFYAASTCTRSTSPPRSTRPTRCSPTRRSTPPTRTARARPTASSRSLDDDAYEHRSRAWARALAAAGARDADVLHLHHLTPINEAAARVAPGRAGRRPPARHRAADARGDRGGPPERWAHAEAWAERMRGWAARCERLLVLSTTQVDARRAAARRRRPSACVEVTQRLRPRALRPRPRRPRAHWGAARRGAARLAPERGARLVATRRRPRGVRATARCCSTSGASPRSSASRC